ncbi:MAG: cellulase family glycosylhydrolase [Oscillospiraceae bacterium]|nr:cellulase family glycosylhydrolase [Oscillospiraceae bacterium]
MIKKSSTIKRIVSISAAAVCMISALRIVPAETDSVLAADTMTPFEITENMKIGWNIGNTLDATSSSARPGLSSETAWGNPKVTQELIDTVKAKGFNTIRIPTTWYQHLDENNVIEEEWLNRVQEVVDYCFKNDMYVILNIHHEAWINRADFATAYDEMSIKLKAIWSQVAERFKDYDQHLIFEGMNEPRAQGTAYEWYGDVPDAEFDNINKLNQDFVSTVRSVDSPYQSTRLLMVTPYCAASDASRYNRLEIPDDDFIAVSIHAYTPYNFTMNSGAGGQHETYTAAFDAELDSVLSGLQKNFTDKDIPVIIGEFSASNFNNTDARCEWAASYITKTKKYGIPCCLWDNNVINNPSDQGEAHGYINRSSYQWYEASEPVVDTMMDVLADSSVAWGSERKTPTYIHQDMSEGKVLYDSSTGQTIDSSVTGGNCSSNYDISLSALEGKDIAVKFTGDAPVAAFMDGNWKNWTEVGPYEVDSSSGIAYVSGAAVAKAWSADTDPAHLCFRTNSKTTILGISIIDAASIQQPTTNPEPTTEEKFPVQTYDITVPEGTLGADFTALYIELNGDAGADANGCLGYMDGEEWKYVEWNTTIPIHGNTQVIIPLKDIPSTATGLQFQIWWAGTDSGFAEIALDNYNVFTTGVPEIIYGDANLDGKVDVTDVVAIMCYASDPESNPLSADALDFADVNQRGNGVNASDAVTVQKYLAKIITYLPEDAA